MLCVIYFVEPFIVM